VRRALQAGHAPASPGATVHTRLAGLLPGFGVGGGAFAALAAKTTAAPALTKAAALIVAGLLAGGAVEETVRSSHPAHHRGGGPALGRGGPASPQAPPDFTLAMLTPAAPAHRSRTAGDLRSTAVTPARASRGGGAQDAVEHDGEHGQDDARHHATAPEADARSGSGDGTDDSGTTGEGEGDASGHSGSPRDDGADATNRAEADAPRSGDSNSGDHGGAEPTERSDDGTVAPVDEGRDVAEASAGGAATDGGSETDHTVAAEPPALATTTD
jgi:hypothetical protein